MHRRLTHRLVAMLLLFATLPAHAAEWIYTVVDGDNLWDFSARHLDTPARFEQIRRLNNIAFPRRLQPGTRLRVPMKWIRSNPVPARIQAIRGDVTLLRAATNTRMQPAAGESIGLGDSLQTGADSSAAVVFADDSIVTLHSESTVHFDHLSAHGQTGMVDSRIRLLDGRVDTRVTPAAGPGSRFEIHTPSAISAVRGTEYRAAVKDSAGTSNIEVLQGKVQVAAQRRQRLVAAGFGTQVKPGTEPLAPRRLLPAPVIAAMPDPVRQVNTSLAWDAVDGALAYRVEIGSGRGFDVLVHDMLTERTRLALPDLADGRYSVRVRGIDAIGLEGNSARRVLQIDTHPQPPVPLQPHDGAVVRGTAAELRWSASADAARYRLEIAADAGFGELLVDAMDLTDTHHEAQQCITPGTYHWRVTSIAADGELGPPGAERVWHVKPVPAEVQPELAAKDDRLVASWRRDAPDQRFQVQLAFDDAFQDLELDRAVTEPAIAIEPLAGRVRYLRVRAIEADGYLGPWGTVQRIDPLPDDSAWYVPLLGIIGLILL